MVSMPSHSWRRKGNDAVEVGIVPVSEVEDWKVLWSLYA